KVIPKNAVEKELLEAYEVASKYNWTKEELEVYDYWSIKEQTQKGSIELAADEAREEAEKKAEKKEKDMILRMHKKGMSIEDIAEIAGISVDRVKEILDGE
ncbi:MAG: transposase family protein, partial [bacterium]|nr:transposase family protein [bacterium]